MRNDDLDLRADRDELEHLSCECYEVVKKETAVLLTYLPQRQLIKDPENIPMVVLKTQ